MFKIKDMKTKFYPLTFIILAGILILGKSALAQQGGLEIPNPLSCNDIGCALYRIATFLLDIATPILTIMILWGGFQILTAAGNPQKLEQGRKTLQWAIIGFAIVLINWGFASIIREILGGGSSSGGGAGGGGSFFTP